MSYISRGSLNCVVIIQLFSKLPKSKCKTITPNRGGEFALYRDFSTACGVDCFFSDPQSPLQRRTNENTNGLLREYLPKRKDISPVSNQFIESVANKLNRPPRKCLGWKTPYEVFYDKTLHLI